MALQNPLLQLSARPKFHVAVRMNVWNNSSCLGHTQRRFTQFQKLSSVTSPSPALVYQSPIRPVTCALNISREESGGSEEIRHGYLKKVINKLEECREPIKAFPWKKSCTNFLHRLFSLAFWAAKWLFLPVLIISSLSEITYSASKNKEMLIPYALLPGSVLAGILKETAIELSDDIQEGEFPWHLYMIGAFFALIKFPGPYYPYFLRIFLPHFANGGLFRTLWCLNIWYKNQPEAAEVETPKAAEVETNSEINLKPNVGESQEGLGI